MKPIRRFTLALAALSLVSCGVSPSLTPSIPSQSEPLSSNAPKSESEFSIAGTSTSEPVSSSSTSSVDENLDATELTYLDVFAYGQTIKITLTLSDAALSFISSYQSVTGAKYTDAYLPADLQVKLNEHTFDYPEVGVRMRGNTSRQRFFSGGEIYALPHLKVNLKATFDDPMYQDEPLVPFLRDWTLDPAGRKARKDRNFLGLEKFDLKYLPRNRIWGDDGCYNREVYAYDVFRRNGIDAPYANVAEVCLQGENDAMAGTYEIIEPIDKQFLKRRYGKEGAKGDLYKCVYNGMGKADYSRSGAIDKETLERLPQGKIGVEDNYIGYAPVYQLKTNDDLGEGSDFSAMAGFIHALWDASYGTLDNAGLEKALDVDQFLKASALTYLLGNFDDQRYNCNNHYLYFRPTDGKAMLIPYDWDWCLGLEAGTDTPLATRRPLDHWTLEGGNSNLYNATLFGEGGNLDREGYKERYLTYVKECKDDALDYSSFLSLGERLGYRAEAEEETVRGYMEEKRNYCA